MSKINYYILCIIIKTFLISRQFQFREGGPLNHTSFESRYYGTVVSSCVLPALTVTDSESNCVLPCPSDPRQKFCDFALALNIKFDT